MLLRRFLAWVVRIPLLNAHSDNREPWLLLAVRQALRPFSSLPCDVLCLCRSNATQPTGVSKQRGGQRVQLHGIIVHGQNGTVYDLSSAFNPDVDEYGASVPPAFVNGSLCILPGNGKVPCLPALSIVF